ncbi:MAG: UDP-N-acetylglucosamine--N-acetylmuramyl-(pentapeptide) pyrophosphoryl-undecaprenol N-acetylglucosamine transferase [Rickettsiales bacterium]|jgi:UDP-N-acetylglucosamine--N-acetylmuramyl-(pentapeptide) pyrophosphoryl-undecaprenol N-acetylglucosamine transferase|nr:UDP-N-acetylglucosamine--N-acetylmuramyl-(pentapeptide) pyrophosphoryl-undecaprenol N-acetylglucosamine transferase [Rickettsiales bacterium]
MKIWIATGGTGGHVFPALAVAAELTQRGNRVTISTDGRVMDMVRRSKPKRAGVCFVWASGVGAKGRLSQAFALFKIGASSVALALRFMLLRPDRVVAFGGYASVPAVFAAHLWKIPTLLHEQNGAIGRANKFMMRWVETLMTSFPKVDGIDQVRSELKIVYTGLPVRPEIAAMAGAPLPLQLKILVTGGSLGAKILDDVAPAAFLLLPAALRKKVFVTHQTRPENVGRLQKFYADNKIRANVLSFIHDMAGAIADSDLVIGRSGASTVVELQTIGRPAIFVPLGINPDQAANAENFVTTGGGFVATQDNFTAKWLAATLTDLFYNQPRLVKMAARALVPNNAVNLIAEEVLK